MRRLLSSQRKEMAKLLPACKTYGSIPAFLDHSAIPPRPHKEHQGSNKSHRAPGTQGTSAGGGDGEYFYSHTQQSNVPGVTSEISPGTP